MTQNDPFIMVRDAVSKSLIETEDIFLRWKEIQSNPYLGSVQELGQLTKQLRERLKGIEWDLEDLDETVRVVESNPERYRLNPEELSRRKGFIVKSSSRVKNIREQMLSLEQMRAQEKRTSSVSDNRYAKLEDDMQKQNQSFIDSNRVKQEQIIRTQDNQLEAISRGVGVLKEVSYAIGDELDDHNELLDELHTDLVTTHSRLGTVSAKMTKVLELSGKKKELICIVLLVVLIVIVVAMFFIPI